MLIAKLYSQQHCIPAIHSLGAIFNNLATISPVVLGPVNPHPPPSSLQNNMMTPYSKWQKDYFNSLLKLIETTSQELLVESTFLHSIHTVDL